MNLTDIEYLYQLMDKQGFKHFAIYDHKRNPMRDQGNPDYTVSDAKDDLQNFLKYNSGVFIVEFRNSKTNAPSSKNYSFTIDNFKSEKPEQSGLGSFGGGGDLMEVIKAKDDRIEKLQSEMFANMISSTQRMHELQLEALRNEMKNSNGGNDKMLETAMTALSGMFGGGAGIGLSGLDTLDLEPVTKQTENNMPIMDDNRRKINAAVVSLMANDSSFADNITKLAELCQDNPMIYNMAISKLKDL